MLLSTRARSDLHRPPPSASRSRPTLPRAAVLVALALLGLAPMTALGGVITVATEVMMEDQSLNSLMLGQFYGVDPNSPLNFTSFVATDGLSYSYSLAPGSTYLGQSLSMSVSSTLDVPSETWTTAMTGALGPAQLSTFGKIKRTDNPDGSVELSSDEDILEGGKKTGDIHAAVQFNPDGTSAGVGFFTKVDGTPDNSTVIFQFDTLKGTKWEKDAKADNKDNPKGSFDIRSTGTSPLEGGAGSFVILISPAPEPSTWVLALVGSSGYLSVALWRRKRAAALPGRGA